MSMAVKDEAKPDQSTLMMEAIKLSGGSDQSVYNMGQQPVPNMVFQDSTPASAQPPAGPQYEAVPLEVPAVPLAEPVQGPKPGSPRWNEMYYKAKKADKLESEVTQLKATVENLAKSMGSVSVSNVTAEMAAIQHKHQEALESGDYSAASKLNTEMMQLMVRKQEMERTFGPFTQAPAYQPQQPPMVDNINQQYQQPQPPIEAIVAAQTFEQNNPWYVEDPGMNAAFNAYHQQTMQDYNWQDRPISAQLNETLRRFRSNFPEKFRQAAPPSAVAGVTPSAPFQQPAPITLSADEMQIASMFAPPGTDPAKAQSEFLKQKIYYTQQGVKF